MPGARRSCVAGVGENMMSLLFFLFVCFVLRFCFSFGFTVLLLNGPFIGIFFFLGVLKQIPICVY